MKYRDRYVVTLETLYKMLQAYLLLSYYCNGDISFYQLTSIPIGGPLSSLVLDMTLGYHEHVSAASHGGNRTKLLAIDSQTILFWRLAVDTALASKPLCSRFLIQKLHSILMMRMYNLVVMLYNHI